MTPPNAPDLTASFFHHIYWLCLEKGVGRIVVSGEIQQRVSRTLKIVTVNVWYQILQMRDHLQYGTKSGSKSSNQRLSLPVRLHTCIDWVSFILTRVLFDFSFLLFRS